MLFEPPDLTADTVLEIVREHWDDGVGACTFVPLGAGSPHWVCAGRRRPRWFVTADQVTADGRLEELLDTYAAVRELADRGHHAVVPTVPPAAGRGPEAAVGVVHGAYLLTVTGYLEGSPARGSTPTTTSGRSSPARSGRCTRPRPPDALGYGNQGRRCAPS